jgi:hypothetical protein
VLRLADGVEAPASGVLFVMARRRAGGPPLAAVRIESADLPRAFVIGPADAMVAGRPFGGPVLLSARMDIDGDPVTRSRADLVASLASPVEPGASDVELVLGPAP